MLKKVGLYWRRKAKHGGGAGGHHVDIINEEGLLLVRIGLALN